MNLSNELISQFVKATKDDKQTTTETTVNGTVVQYGGKTYVKLDGSDLLTPVRTTADVKEDERVTVSIKDHTATITGNMTSPAARTDDVKEVASHISEFEIIVSHRVNTDELQAITAVIETLRADLINVGKLDVVLADIEDLEAKFANVEYLNANEINAIVATIEKLEAHVGNFTDLSTDNLEALTAEIQSLKGYTADFVYVSAEQLEAINAKIKNLDVTNLDTRYANIDFANINEAAIEKLFSDSGIIKDLIVSEGKITGELVGVTIKGDLIEAGTLKADIENLMYDFDDLVEPIEEDAIHGSVMVANSITAEKIAVDDLVAFDATIGGFIIDNNAIRSVGKGSATAGTRGVYLDNDGQLAVGDTTNFLRYFKDSDGNYKLEISASSLVFSTSGKNVEQVIEDALDIEVGARNLIRNSVNMLFEDYYFEGVIDDNAIVGKAVAGIAVVGKG